MKPAAIVCAACGAKVLASRSRCPRCRAVLSEIPVAGTQLPGKVRAIAGVALAIAVVGTSFVLWRNRDQAIPPAPRIQPAVPQAPSAALPATSVENPDIPPRDPAFRLPSDIEPVSGGNVDSRSLERFQTAIERDPQNVLALYGAGRTLLGLGRTAESLGPLKQAMAWRPDNWSYAVTYGYAAALAEQWSEAAAGFRPARTLMPDDATTSFDLALALQKLGDYEGAVREYSTATELAGDMAAARLGLAISLDRLGRNNEAVEAYRASVRLDPDGADAQRIRTRIRKLTESRP